MRTSGEDRLMARAHLVNPFSTLSAAARYEYYDAPWPKHLPAKPKPPL